MKSKNQITFSILIGMLLFFMSSAIAQKSIQLQYNLSVGDSYIFVSDIDQDVSFEAMGSTMALNQDMSFQMTSTVKKIEGDEIIKEFTFDKISMIQKIMGMEIVYDSEDSSTWNSGMGAEVASEMNKVIGKSSEIVMDNKGNIIDINISSVTDNSELTNNLTSGSTYAVYPDGKIKIGDSWENDIVPLKDSEMKVHVKYTLLKTTRKQAVIVIEGILTGNEVQGVEMQLNGTTVGKMTVDRATGMLISSTIDLEMAMEMEKDGMKIPTDILTTSVTSAKKVN
ncbi:MAG: hypothetical protein HQ521_06805 [Bacteroidetes bacterium]|nr:hypothetical protein [Bacteroidota bacterium]